MAKTKKQVEDVVFGTGCVDKPEDFFKERAWRDDEIAGTTTREGMWVEKKINEFITYPKRNQNNQSSCVSYTLAKQLAVDELQENKVWRELSPRSIYAYTAIPGVGSSSITATKLAIKQGMTLEYLLRTDGLLENDVIKTDGYASDAKQIALVYKPQSYVECATDFETIAAILQRHKDQGIKKVIAITVIGENNGTWHSTFPQIPNNPNTAKSWYHRVAVTDFGLINGKKVLAIDNSWGENIGNKGQQFLTEEYQPFMYGGMYTLNQEDNWQQIAPSTVTPPKYFWSADLDIGSTGQDVFALQRALQSMGMFPVSSIVKITGAYFGITKKGVELFQVAMALPVTGKVDIETRAKLNAIFKQ
jgi:hypothetical protein